MQAIVKKSMEEALERNISEVLFVVEPRVAEAWGSQDLQITGKILSQIFWELESLTMEGTKGGYHQNLIEADEKPVDIHDR